MATSAQIQAALADAAANDLDYRQQALLLRRAVTNALVTGTGEITLPFTAVGADGAQITTMSIDAALTMAVRLENLATGGIVAQYVEFPR